MSDGVQGISGRQLADLLKVSEGAVRKAVEKGRIKRLPNGRFDPVACAAAWKANTDPSQQRRPGPTVDASAPKAATPPRPKIVPSPVREPDKVVQFPGPKHKPGGGKPPKAKKPTAPQPDDEDGEGGGEGGGEGIPALVADLYKEKIRKLRNENDLTERVQYDGELTDLMLEGFASESRESWQQYVDKYYSEVAAALGLQDREGEVYAVLLRTIKAHTKETIDKIDHTRWLKRVRL